MKLVQVDGGTITVSMLWTEAAAIAEALEISGFDGESSASAFLEAAAYASYLAAGPADMTPELKAYDNIQPLLRESGRFVLTALSDKVLRERLSRVVQGSLED